jgi:hypothetical protein
MAFSMHILDGKKVGILDGHVLVTADKVAQTLTRLRMIAVQMPLQGQKATADADALEAVKDQIGQIG